MICSRAMPAQPRTARRALCAALLLALVPACGDDDATPATDLGPPDAGAADANIARPDLALPDLGPPTEVPTNGL